jgi:hypothetical protein
MNVERLSTLHSPGRLDRIQNGAMHTAGRRRSAAQSRMLAVRAVEPGLAQEKAVRGSAVAHHTMQ